MTMHLARGLTTTNTKRRKQSKKPGWQKAQAEHDAYLMKMGAHPSQRKAREKENLVRGDKCYGSTAGSNPVREGSIPSSPAKGIGYDKSMAKPAPKVYTGTFITGIATMHKSNLVPVNKNTNGSDYATMRRG